MSAQRFIRCKHCNLPHEAEAVQCPVTGKPLTPAPPKARSVPPPSAKSSQSAKREGPRAPGSKPPTQVAAEGYQWEHSLHPWSQPNDEEAPDALSLTGRIVENKYKIIELIGRGGMGAVYRAENTRIGKQVAIKILLKGYEKGSESERRFLREARIAGSLGHPNIVEIFDLGMLENGAPFQVMELLEGQTLASRIKFEGALPIEEGLDVCEQVLSALEAAHDRGIIHRDLKPDNIFLIERQGQTIAKILDFGVAKNLANEDQTMSLTMTGVVVGTPYYLAPEQARGDRAVDRRVDLWAMGVAMYEAMTGTLPFKADNYNALLVKILNSRPVPPSKLRPAIPQEIEDVILGAMEFDPKDRWASADAMLRVLRTARGKRHVSTELPLASRREPKSSSERLPELPLIEETPGDLTLADLSISMVQPPRQEAPDDPTEISESFRYSEIDNSGRKRR